MNIEELGAIILEELDRVQKKIDSITIEKKRSSEVEELSENYKFELDTEELKKLLNGHIQKMEFFISQANQIKRKDNSKIYFFVLLLFLIISIIINIVK